MTRLRPAAAAAVAAFGLVVGGLAGVVASTGLAPAAEAANTAAFDPGNLISDQIFYDAGSMSAADIQDFLTAKGSGCVPNADGTPCLKDYHQATSSRAATTRCSAYEGAADESAAQIVAKVAEACGINPRVILVTLQKEQSLVTRRIAGSASTYQRAMGYRCPDTAPCDPQYFGFDNQVYSAASQFKNYALNPTWFSHRAAAWNTIAYNPDSSCGSSSVYIRNQATASLYNYTPYQPNAAALAAGYGVGDSCSAYGNRNFWEYFSDWFGSPTGVPPVGYLDSVTVSGTQISAAGWAYDADTTATSITVHMYVDSASQAFVANGSRPDVDAVFHTGTNHGFTTTMTAAAGTHDVCLWAINTDTNSGNTLLGCRTVVVPRPLQGYLDTVVPDPEGVTATGWAYDPDAGTAPVSVRVTVDGVATTTSATLARPDVAAALGIDPNHGYSVRIPATLGTHQVCVTALKAAPGVDRELGCRTVTVVNHPPFGYLDSVNVSAGTVTASGWAIDPDTTGPITVHLYVDGASKAFTASMSRPDVDAFYHLGANHGYVASLPITAGTHTVCVYAINSTPGPNPELGCRTVTGG